MLIEWSEQDLWENGRLNLAGTESCHGEKWPHRFSAIKTGNVDFELSITEIAQELTRIGRAGF